MLHFIGLAPDSRGIDTCTASERLIRRYKEEEYTEAFHNVNCNGRRWRRTVYFLSLMLSPACQMVYTSISD